MRKLEKLIQRFRLTRYAVVYMTFVLVVLVMIVVLVVKPKLEKNKGWLGIKVQRDGATGTLVLTDVIAGSPAFDVGMLQGDRLLSYGGVAVSDVNTLKQMIAGSYLNEVVRIVIERKGSDLVADTRIAERPPHVTVLPPVITVSQGMPPHPERGPCLRCHTIVPANRR